MLYDATLGDSGGRLASAAFDGIENRRFRVLLRVLPLLASMDGCVSFV